MSGVDATDRANATLVLVGYRASGKSTLGRAIAESLARPFFDVDLEIEFAHGVSIREMFEQHGEEWFRDVEEATVADLLSRPGVVLALGGGAVGRPATRRRLCEADDVVVIYLNPPLATLTERLRANQERPALTDLPLEQEVARMVTARDPLYREVAGAVLDIAPNEMEQDTLDRLRRRVQEVLGTADRRG